MAKKRKKVKTLPTIWHVPDELWNKIKPIIEQYDLIKPTGQKRIDPWAETTAPLAMSASPNPQYSRSCYSSSHH